jgi:hypothetical protein
MSDSVEIEGVRLFLGKPDATQGEWIGQREVLKQLLACWLVVDPKDLPLSPRIVGRPGNVTSRSLSISAPPTPAPKTC